MKNKKKIMVCSLLLALSAMAAQAQNYTVSGTVTEANGDPIIGATIAQKGHKSGTVTDINGHFSIQTDTQSPTLEIHSIGYDNREVRANAQHEMHITLKDNSTSLEGVVVTALGIKREEKSLGYSVGKVNGDELSKSVSGNWLNEMRGKVAGLNLTDAGTGPLSSMRVTLRGDHSLDHGNSGTLFVVDGVPINAGTTATGSGSNYANGDGPVDFGNGAGDLNPDDIASVTVLKGAAATALYGSMAGNGAIVITTKSGSGRKGLGITVNSSLTIDKASYFPDFQTEYGSGSDSGLNPFCFWTLDKDEAPDGIATKRNISRYAFGEKFDATKMRYQYGSKNWDNGTYEMLPWQYADDWYTGFFQTGTTWRNSVTLSGGNGKGASARASLTDTRNTWITPNTGYASDAVALAFDTPLNNKIKLGARINYINKRSDNLPVSGYSAQSPMYALVWGYNNNPISYWKDEYFQGRYNAENYTNTDGTHGHSLVYPAEDSYNPYRTAYEELNSLDKNRVYGNFYLNFTLAKGLTLNLRSAVDLNDEWRTQQKPFYTPNHPTGFYREQSIRNQLFNNDFLLKYTNNDLVGKHLSMTLSFGGNAMEEKYYHNRVTLDQLQNDGVYNIYNVPSGYIAEPYNYRSKKKINSLYGFASLAWDDTYFLDITDRNDWSSTLSRKNRSYNYPSVSASVLLDKVLGLDKHAKWIDMLKYRLSWADVGIDTDPYSLDRYYSSTSYPGGYTISGTIPDANIKPENEISWETGIEAKMFHGRLSLDLTYYDMSIKNQIVNVAADQITGATGYTINAGKISNKGLEVTFSAVPVRTKDWEWGMDINWAKNWNKLVKLQDGWDASTPLQASMGTTIGSRVYIYSYVGQEMYQIYGRGYQRAPEGSYYLDENGNKVDCSGMKLIDKNGYPMLDNSPTKHIARVTPLWKAGMTQRLRYKNVSLSGVFSAQVGGHCFSVTNFSLSYQGKLKNSLAGRYDGLVVDGVQATDQKGVYKKNTTVTPSIETYYNTYVWNRNNTEENTFSTNFLKLKELRLDFDFPQNVLRRTHVLQGASLGLFATNVFCITPFPQYDPEAGMVNGTDICSGIEAMTYPMTRSYGINVKLTF